MRIWKFLKQALQPTEFSRWERILIRVLLVCLVWFSIPWVIGYQAQPEPVGMARFADLSYLGQPGWNVALNVVICLSLIGYLFGWFQTLSIVVLALAFNAVYTLDNSQGSDHHHAQVLGLVLAVMAVHRLVVSLAVWFGWKDHPERRRRFAIRDIFFAQQAVVATYLVSGITKLKTSGLGWITDAQFFPLSIRKNDRMEHFNVLDKVDKTPGEDGWLEKIPRLVEQQLLESPTLAMIVIGSGLILELGAVFALFGRIPAIVIGAMLVLFHLTVSEVMSLDFDLNIGLLLILFLIPNLIWLALSPLRMRSAGPDSAHQGFFHNISGGVAAVWRGIPMKPFLLLLFASFLVIKGPTFRLGFVSGITDEKGNLVRSGDRIEQVRADLKAAEFYPLSPFPMYSRYSDRPIYVYLTDENDDPIAVIPELNLQSSQVKKIYDGELRKLKVATGIPMSKMSAEQKKPAGEAVLRLIRDELSAEQLSKSDRKRLKLHEVVITQGKEGIEKAHVEVAQLDL